MAVFQISFQAEFQTPFQASFSESPSSEVSFCGVSANMALGRRSLEMTT